MLCDLVAVVASGRGGWVRLKSKLIDSAAIVTVAPVFLAGNTAAISGALATAPLHHY